MTSKQATSSADFGAARELPEEGEFNSIYGTEEYWNPKIGSALVDPQSRRGFPAAVDLWSIGVTYFQAATGFLPFKTFRGRGDRQLVHWISWERQPGSSLGSRWWRTALSTGAGSSRLHAIRP